MSGFKRTLNGLNNQHLFHNVDIIVMVEGGPTSFTKQDVQSGRFTAETEDVVFWSNIFNRFVDNKKLKFKPIGSKSVIKEIALDIVSGSLQTVFVAMDNEFDEVLNNRIQHNSVFYTHGYSFENDIWGESVIKAVIEELTAIEIANVEIERNFKNFLSAIKIAVYADGYLFKRGSSFFPRKSGHMFCVNMIPAELPSIKKPEINARILSKSLVKASLYSFGSRFSIDTLKFCYGHFLADYCYQLIMQYVKNKHFSCMVSKDIINRMGIRKFFNIQFTSGAIFEYYREQFSSKGHVVVA